MIIKLNNLNQPSSASEYAVVSHVWGSTSLFDYNGRKVKVSCKAKLDTVLTLAESCDLWVDFLSINQDDPLDVISTMDVMRDIYECAHTTFILLPKSDYTELANAFNSFVSTLDACNDPEDVLQNIQHIVRYSRTIEKALEGYNSRLWTLQESVLSRRKIWMNFEDPSLEQASAILFDEIEEITDRTLKRVMWKCDEVLIHLFVYAVNKIYDALFMAKSDFKLRLPRILSSLQHRSCYTVFDLPYATEFIFGKCSKPYGVDQLQAQADWLAKFATIIHSQPGGGAANSHWNVLSNFYGKNEVSLEEIFGQSLKRHPYTRPTSVEFFISSESFAQLASINDGTISVNTDGSACIPYMELQMELVTDLTQMPPHDPITEFSKTIALYEFNLLTHLLSCTSCSVVSHVDVSVGIVQSKTPQKKQSFCQFAVNLTQELFKIVAEKFSKCEWYNAALIDSLLFQWAGKESGGDTNMRDINPMLWRVTTSGNYIRYVVTSTPLPAHSKVVMTPLGMGSLQCGSEKSLALDLFINELRRSLIQMRDSDIAWEKTIVLD